MEPVMAYHAWPTNAHLIADCARLGYLRPEWRTLDPTYGSGVFWRIFRPNLLFASDINPEYPCHTLDFTKPYHEEHSFDCVVLDPPYKLNGTPSKPDKLYGTDKPTRWQDRMSLMWAMLNEGARVLGDGYLLFKCQDQVVSGKVRWQTQTAISVAAVSGLGLVDRLDMLSYRPQPEGTSQVHARRNGSTMLVFKRGHVS